MKALHIINYISLTALLFYPVVFIVGIMVFDSPGSNKVPLSWIIAISCISYPILIGVCFFFSRKLDSLPIALVGILPTLILIILFTSGIKDSVSYEASQNKEAQIAYASLSRDFVCEDSSFLHITDPSIDGDRSVIGLIRESSSSYSKNSLVWIYENKYLGSSDSLSDWAKKMISNCKNSEGKSITEVYEPLPKGYLEKRFPQK